ncbi:helix-turn-helix domain-containing protein [Antarcticimicrobium luteum]|uniref:HTH DNA binding domain-containing protein n=1 Tax=Antarcticimicrobium luteum TaxID=2547397 RepID=A0A4R5V1T1_9RHOB|nr:helix-turn-helix domain-containing protein [Antarcticimicrobium luteum]TDK45723.1 hypothetical protein E1832_13770 [Antarcticimicrobium luteum]
MLRVGAIPDIEDLEDDETPEEDLWFLPGPDPEEDVPPGAAPDRRGQDRALFDPEPWQAAQADLARELAEVAGLFGALDQRLRTAPAGWRQRLALREVSDLSWWTGDRLGPERIGLWVTLRAGSTRDTERALARAGWAMRRLAPGSGPAPAPSEDLAVFLDRLPGPAARGRTGGAPAPAPDRAVEDALADLAEVMAGEQALHPITAAARLFHAWRALGPAGSVDLEAAVLAARHAAAMSRAPGQGAIFLPLAQTGAGALRGQGDPHAKLSAWLRGAERATLAALLHLDRVAAWRQNAEAVIADFSGRTPPALIALLGAWPQVSAPMAGAETGASRAAVQRNLDRLVQRGLIREITGQERFRVWAARLVG